MNPRIRIKDIAEKAGVSLGTVDRVLHNRGHVAAEVRAKVLRVVEELGYEPNIMASRLAASGRPTRISALIPNPDADPFWRQPCQGILRAAKAVEHYSVEVQIHPFDLFDPHSFSREARKLLDRHPDGVVVPALFLLEATRFLDNCHREHLPYALFNTEIARKDESFVCYIGQDSYHSDVLAGKLLNFGIETGDTVLILHLEKEVSNALHLVSKEQGFRDFFVSVPERNIRIVEQSFAEFDSAEAMEVYTARIIREIPRLSGIFVTNSRAWRLAGCMEKLRMPHIKLVGFDLIPPNVAFLHRNVVDFLINQNPTRQGFLSIINLFNHLVLKKEVERLQYLPLDIVMTENVDYYLKDRDMQEIFV
ncbi:MAG: LacI family DNA-binding transcriptional regulator [Saprospirales bacterium]|nr:LacI family DNA-binding transcriptional regulator [Saprospirales bacterium]